MGGGYSVDPAGLETAAGGMSKAASQVDAARKALAAAVSGLADAIGHDRPGEAFAGQVLPAQGHLLTLLANMATGLDSVGGGLRTEAANYRGADAASNTEYP